MGSIGRLDAAANGAGASNAALIDDTLVLEANHRIANHLAAISGLVRLHAAGIAGSRQMSGEEVRVLLREIAGRIETVGRLHMLLSEDSTGGMVDLGHFLGEVCAIAVASLAATQRVTLEHDCARDCALRRDQAVPLALIVNELVTNAVKYAHPTGIAGTIAVCCRREAAGGLVVEVADDGVGLPEGFDPLTANGLGLVVVRSLSEQLGARFAFFDEGLGLRFRLELPQRTH